MISVSICGVGRIGGALALALKDSAIQVDRLIVRNAANPEVVGDEVLASKVVHWEEVDTIDSDVVLVATGDCQIHLAAEQIANLRVTPGVVLHTNGSLSASILEGIFNDTSIGSMHPLVSITSPRTGARHFEGAYFCIDGDKWARSAAKTVADAVGAKVFSVPENKRALYHASAVTACGHLVALVDVAIEMFDQCGFSSTEARQILLPLIKSTADNLETAPPASALTGPFARGDVETFERHLSAIRKDVSHEALEIYLKLALRSVQLVLRENGLNTRSEALEQVISMAKQNAEC